MTNGPRSATLRPARVLARIQALPASRRAVARVNSAAFAVGTLGVLAAGALGLSGPPGNVRAAREPAAVPAAASLSSEAPLVRPLVAGSPVTAALARRRPSPVEALILDAFGPIGPQAIAVARCESSLDPSAVSAGGGNFGLFQINRIAHEPWLASLGYRFDELLDPRLNVLVARAIYQRAGGWEPWACDWAAAA